MAEEDAGG